jgi:hypothetical protein
MKRFRFTLLAICLVLLYLGWIDVTLLLRNPSPASVSIEELERGNVPREWLHVTGGHQNLLEAISTSGSVELESFLVPLKSTPEEASFHVLVETRNPRILELLAAYHFQLDSVEAKEDYLKEHAAEFQGQRDVTGTVVSGLVASGNRDKLMKLAREVGMQVPPDVLFLSEGKEPGRWRGFFYLGIGLLGLIKVLTLWKKPPQTVVAG